MPEFLLTEDELREAYEQDEGVVAQAQLRKVAVWLSQHTEGRYYPITRWSEEEWKRLMQEAGLDKPDLPHA